MKKILILMIEVGSSHKMSALAVKDAIEKIAPDRYQIKVMDFAKEVGALNTDRFLKNSWDTALSIGSDSSDVSSSNMLNQEGISPAISSGVTGNVWVILSLGSTENSDNHSGTLSSGGRAVVNIS